MTTFPSTRPVHDTGQAGFSLIELLMTLLVVMIGLQGLVTLQATQQVSQVEAYQRAQATVLLSDIQDRLQVFRKSGGCLAFTTDASNGTPFLGADVTDANELNLAAYTCSGEYATEALTALNEIHDLMEGAAEVKNGNKVGAMVGARACIHYDSGTELTDATGSSMSGTGEYTLTVSWQGMANTVASSANCANGYYGDERLRRAVTATVRFGELY